VQRCKAGEKKAFHELYHLYSKAMFNIAVRIINNKEEAEEALQDSFLKAFENIQKFDGKNSFGVWLKRIVINRSLDVIKKRKINFVPIGENDFAEDEPEVDDEIIYDVETIKASVLQLPDGYRTILILFLFEDYSHKEIAEVLNISEGTSKSQYSRARKKLVELMKQNIISNGR
jgi:RNA polymerase sigma factor (sigma-70 family)